VKGKTLVLVRNKNVLRIYDGIIEPGGISYTAIFNITHLKTDTSGWYDLYNNKEMAGFVSGVREIKEKW